MRTSILLTALYCAAIFLLNPACSSESKPPEQTIAYASKDSAWSEFRNNFRYHIQTIGISEIKDDNSVILVISEPPPHVTKLELEAQLIKYKVSIEEKANKIGHDGWVKDVLVVVSGIKKKGLDKLVKNLSKYLFFTDYKYYAIELPILYKPNIFLNNLNYKIQASELERWFFTDQEKFFFADDSTIEYTLAEAQSIIRPGLLYSKKPGIVAWLLRENDYITSQEEIIRKFTLDADLILGAVRNMNGIVAIIGRERLNNLYDLPPLRVETIIMLASADKEQISQSYERRSMFAGKMSGGKDWAPIYLSKDLINTEYGSLLNITDQMLKSWSTNGGVDYIDFSYPKPSYYTYAKGIQDVINTNNLTFNWNTKGVGYTIAENDNEFFCINRTGALPVTYIPEGSNAVNRTVEECEKKAYNYFAWLNNPDLVRVVQYASLYQIFSKYNIKSSYYQNNFTSQMPSQLTNTTERTDTGNVYASDLIQASPIKTRVKELITTIQNFDEQKLEEIADNIYKDDLDLMTKFILDMDINSAHSKMEEWLSLFSYNAEDEFAEIITNPRDFKPIYEEDLYKLDAAYEFVKLLGRTWKYIMPRALTESIMEEFVKSRQSSAGPWIKTPSVVVSWSTEDSSFWIGGHNLNAKVTRFRVSDDAAKGKFNVIEENGYKTILINRKDISNIDPNILRKLGDPNKIPDQLFVSDLHYQPRSRNEVFPFENQRPGGRGLSKSHILISEEQDGFIINGKKVTNCEELVNDLTLLASNNKPEILQVRFERISENRAKALIKSSEIKLASTNLNRGGILHSGDVFNISRTKYNFSKAKVNGDLSKHEIVVEIPMISNAQSRVRFSIKGFLLEAKQQIVDGIKRLFGRAKSSDINFYDELMKELKQYNIKPADIEVEVDDCIICHKSKENRNGNC